MQINIMEHIGESGLPEGVLAERVQGRQIGLYFPNRSLDVDWRRSPITEDGTWELYFVQTKGIAMPHTECRDIPRGVERIVVGEIEQK